MAELYKPCVFALEIHTLGVTQSAIFTLFGLANAKSKPEQYTPEKRAGDVVTEVVVVVVVVK